MRKFVLAAALLTIVTTTAHGQTNQTAVPAPTQSPPNDPAALVAALDTDKDGAISKAEWLAAGRREQRFTRIDANSDGKVTLEEIKAAIAAMAANPNRAN